MLEDIFDIVNDQDEVIDSAPRSHVHANGLLHRAVHIFVFNEQHELLIQLRSDTKDLHPNTWDTSCCGHVDSGEDYLTAAIREFDEELGPETPPELTSIGKAPPCEATGHEFVMVYRCVHAGPFHPCPKEIKELRWISLPDLEKEMQEHPETYAPALPHLWNDFKSLLS